ncbi:glycosyltransferase [bacterium AH-315-P15]|nr:glycosyltransferase [bacterium AH-315-P15]
MRILIAHNFYQQAGGEDAVYHAECEMLERAGHEVVRYELRNDSIQGLGGRISSALDAPFSRAQYRQLTRLMTGIRPDIVHTHNFFPLLTPAIFQASSDLGIPSVLTLHNYRLTCAGAQLYRNGKPCELCLNASAYHGALHRCYRGSVVGSFGVARMIETHRRRRTWQSSVTRFIALTPFARGKFIEAGLPAGKLVVKPNFVIDPGAPELPPAQSREEFVFLGRLSEEKGLHTLLRAWRGSDQTLRIIGDGPERAALEAIAPRNVTFTGTLPADTVRAALAGARALLVPSRWYEGFPMVIVEAFAAGVPVIASRIGSLTDLILPGQNGELVDVGDIEQWQAIVQRFSENTALATACAQGARKTFVDLYSEKQNLKQLEDIYESAISAPDALPDAPLSEPAE